MVWVGTIYADAAKNTSCHYKEFLLRQIDLSALAERFFVDTLNYVKESYFLATYSMMRFKNSS